MKAKKMLWAAILSAALGSAALASDSWSAPRRNDRDRGQATWQAQRSGRDRDNARTDYDRRGVDRDDQRGADRDHQRGAWNSPYVYGDGSYDAGVYNGGADGRDIARHSQRDRDGDRDDAQRGNRTDRRNQHVDRDHG